MPSAIEQLFSSESFMPHGHCYLWSPGLVWLEVSANAVIALSYFAISATLAWLVTRIRDLPFKAAYLAFGFFIVACGVTHAFDILTVWKPFYWLDGAARAVTAVASLGTAVMLPTLVPRVVDLARGVRAAQAEGLRLETAVADLGARYEKSRRLERLQSRFFANASVDLRVPVEQVLAPMEKLLARDLPRDERHELETARRHAQALLRQIDELLDASMATAGATPSAGVAAQDLAAPGTREAARAAGRTREPDAFYIFDAVREGGVIVDFALVEANAHGLSRLRLERARAIGQRLAAVYPPSGGDGFLSRLARAVESGQSLEEELQAGAAVYQLRAVPLGNGVAITASDVTAERQASRER